MLYLTEQETTTDWIAIILCAFVLLIALVVAEWKVEKQSQKVEPVTIHCIPSPSDSNLLICPKPDYSKKA